MTLLRHTVNIMMGFQGIIAREFVSNNGMLIITVCFGHEYNTKMVTEYLRMKQFLDVNYIDLMSLEPLDSKRRPLRLNKYLNSISQWKLLYGENHNDLFHRIHELIDSINFKKMIKDFRGIWDNDMVKPENCEMQIYDHAKEPLMIWNEFKEYLERLNQEVIRIRENFFIEKKKILMRHVSKFEGNANLGILLHNLLMKETAEDTDLDIQIKEGLKKLKLEQTEEEDQKLISILEEYLNEIFDPSNEGKLKLKIRDLTNLEKMPDMYLKEIHVLKDDQGWFFKKKEALYKQLCVEYFDAMKESFVGCKHLTNKWIIWKQRPIGGHKEFVYPRNKRRKRLKMFLSMIWKKYKSKSNKSTIHDEFEKLRSMDFQLNKMIQMGELSLYYENIFDEIMPSDMKSINEIKIVKNAIQDICFPMHNYFRFRGEISLHSIFDQLVDEIGSNKIKIIGNQQFIVPKPATEKANELKKLFKMSNLPEDIVSKLKTEIDGFKQDKESNLTGKYEVLKTKMKIWPLNEIFKTRKFFGIGLKSTFPTYTLRDYFGPKIALYFYFVGFFSNRLYLIGIIGAILYFLKLLIFLLISMYFVPDNLGIGVDYSANAAMFITIDIITWIFCLYVFAWSFRFYRDWKLHEKIFQINNGDTDENTGNILDEERVTIKEYYYSRSLITDELNTKSNFKRLETIRIILGFIFTFLIGLLSVGMSVGIIELKMYLRKFIPREQLFNFDLLPCKFN